MSSEWSFSSAVLCYFSFPWNILVMLCCIDFYRLLFSGHNAAMSVSSSNVVHMSSSLLYFVAFARCSFVATTENETVLLLRLNIISMFVFWR